MHPKNYPAIIVYKGTFKKSKSTINKFLEKLRDKDTHLQEPASLAVGWENNLKHLVKTDTSIKAYRAKILNTKLVSKIQLQRWKVDCAKLEIEFLSFSQRLLEKILTVIKGYEHDANSYQSVENLYAFCTKFNTILSKHLKEPYLIQSTLNHQHRIKLNHMHRFFNKIITSVDLVKEKSLHCFSHHRGMD